MNVIATLYYHNHQVDAQALTIRKKKGRPNQIAIHIDDAVNHTIAPALISKVIRDAARQPLTPVDHGIHEPGGHP